MNKVTLIGRLTKDPECKQTPSGVTVCRFDVAVSRNYKSQDGTRQADFIPVVVWRQLAENCGKYLQKGKMCAVDGRMETRSYEATDGSKRFITEVIAENVEFLSPAEKKQTVEDLPDVEMDDSQLPF